MKTAENFDKYILLAVLAALHLLVIYLVWSKADVTMQEWAKQSCTGVLGALLMAVQGDKSKPLPPMPTSTTMTDQPSGARSSTPTIGEPLPDVPPQPTVKEIHP